MNSPIDNILTKLSNVKQTGSGFTAHCPCHDDKQSSLSISESDTGAVLIHCHAGCETANVLDAIGLKMSDLYPPKQMGSTNQMANAKIAARYKYTDADKKLLYEVVRYEPKGFRQRQPNGKGGWNWSMKGVNRVLYQLPIVKEAIKRGQTIFVVEGEKDAVNVIQKLKFPATTNVGGAEKWNVSYSKTLKGANVVILPDNDEPGSKHAQIVAQALQEYAKSVKIVELPGLPNKGDVSDWINNGGTRDELLKMADDTPYWEPEPMQTSTADVHNANSFPLTDLGNAERLVNKYGDTIRYNVDSNKWLIWNGMRWESDNTGEIDRMARRTIRGIADEIKTLYDKLQTASSDDAKSIHTRIDELNKHMKTSEAKYRLDAMTALAQHCDGIPITANMLDRNDWLLNCSNGILDLRTGKLKPHDKNALITKLVPVDYDADAKCQRFEQFMREIFGGDRELIQFVQRAIGYTLTGDTSEQCFFILHGDGSNGKSTLVNVMREILRDYHRSTGTDTLMSKKNASVRDQESVGRLMGARFVSAVETDVAQHLAEGLLKSMSGEDSITGCFLYGNQFDFVPTFKLWLACNHKPIITGDDTGIWRRIKLIPFNVQFNSKESGKPPYKDAMLADKLRMEYPGILAWMVRGCLDFQFKRLGTCKAVSDSTDSYRAEQDIIAAFLDECCVVSPTEQIQSSELYSTYKNWCEENGHRGRMSNKTFSDKLVRRGFSKTHSMYGNVWTGIGLNETALQDEPIYVDDEQITNVNNANKCDGMKNMKGMKDNLETFQQENSHMDFSDLPSYPSYPSYVSSELDKHNNSDSPKTDKKPKNAIENNGQKTELSTNNVKTGFPDHNVNDKMVNKLPYICGKCKQPVNLIDDDKLTYHCICPHCGYRGVIPKNEYGDWVKRRQMFENCIGEGAQC